MNDLPDHLCKARMRLRRTSQSNESLTAPTNRSIQFSLQDINHLGVDVCADQLRQQPKHMWHGLLAFVHQHYAVLVRDRFATIDPSCTLQRLLYFQYSPRNTFGFDQSTLPLKYQRTPAAFYRGCEGFEQIDQVWGDSQI